MKLWLAAMEIEVRDESELFSLLDRDGDGNITVQELVDGMRRLKGAARNYDLVDLQKGQKMLVDMMQDIMQQAGQYQLCFHGRARSQVNSIGECT